jgi:hypothetical protein
MVPIAMKMTRIPVTFKDLLKFSFSCNDRNLYEEEEEI